MAGKKMPMGMGKSEESGEGHSPKDFASALADAPESMEPGEPPEEDGEALDPEQAHLAEQMGLDPQEGIALKRFIKSCHGGY